MKKLFFMLALVAMSVLAMGQDNQLVWANGRLLYGTPIESIDSLTYDEIQDIDTLHLLLPRTLIKVVHDTVYIHDTVYVETDCGGEGDTPSAGIGVFSVSADKQVTFSKGNLQYHPANDVWRFAENQWDYVGEANSNIAADYAGWLDLFGWGTGDCPTKASEDYTDYPIFVDWGTNTIGNDAPNTWRTLTMEEFQYIEYTRKNASDLMGIAQVNGVNGVIILPDNWVCPVGITFKSGFHTEESSEAYALYQTFDSEQWSRMEALGAVFIPASGWRKGKNVGGVESCGCWWHSTSLIGNQGVLCTGGISIYSTGIIELCSTRAEAAYSVRLVKDLEDETTGPEIPTNTENGHEYVDLGLSVKWATCNVGANAPEEYGDYFAWGETEPKEEYTLSNYKWSDGTYSGMSKYEMHSLTTLEKEDDVANIHWGSTWHTPTHLNWEELRTDCNWTLLTHNGIDGYKVTGPNGNSIFIPMGDYWSSSLYIEGSSSYLSYGHNSNLNSYGRWIYYRETGNSIRPVCK